MDIFVCIKQVPDLAEADIEIAEGRRGIMTDDLDQVISEWDLFAVETAIRLKEAHGGRVTVLTVGEEEAEDVLRRALAMGADAAMRLWDADFAGSDAWGLATILHQAITRGPCDLVLTGAISADEGRGQVGGFIAGLLDVPFVALATELLVDGQVATVRHEIDGGREQVVQVDLPALVSVQTGICEPRYVSIRGIRKVAGVEIPVVAADQLGLDTASVGEAAVRVKLEDVSLPLRGGDAEMLEGSPDEVLTTLVTRLSERGVL